MAGNLKYTYWRDGEFFIGFLNDYPDYRTQGTSKDDLVENLKSLLEDIESDEIPFIRKVIQTDFNASGSPFSLREKVRMRGIKSNIFVDDFDPLTPTLSRRAGLYPQVDRAQGDGDI